MAIKKRTYKITYYDLTGKVTTKYVDAQSLTLCDDSNNSLVCFEDQITTVYAIRASDFISAELTDKAPDMPAPRSIK